MGEQGDEEQLCAFLNAVLGRHSQDALVSLEILENKMLTAEVLGDKTSILDVRAKSRRGERINIEVQLRNLGNMDRRSLFYWSLEFSRSMEAGQDYRESPNVIAINIVNYVFMSEAPGFHLKFHIWEDTYRLLLTDALEIHFIDMVKFRRLTDRDIQHNELHRWLTWLDKESPRELVEEAIRMDQAIQKAEAKMGYVTQDKEVLRAYQIRELAMSDWTSGINHAREEGREEGIQEGMAQGMQRGQREKALEIARNLQGLGIPEEQIAQATGLSLEEIAQI
jgi:predicted transposase/invertase (TIGR01784 family)